MHVDGILGIKIHLGFSNAYKKCTSEVVKNVWRVLDLFYERHNKYGTTIIVKTCTAGIIYIYNNLCMDPIQKELIFNNKSQMLYLSKLRVLFFEKKIAFGYTI